MLIKIINVSQPEKIQTARGGYFTMEVNYKDEQGKTQGKKLMSFSSPEVFNTLKTAAQNDQFDITSEKDKNGYWQWIAISKADGAQPSSSSGAKPAASVAGRSTYETPEERAARQKLIVRQSSLTAALATLSVGAKAINKDEVKALAQEYSDWVFEVKDEVVPNPADLSDIDDDIPY